MFFVDNISNFFSIIPTTNKELFSTKKLQRLCKADLILLQSESESYILYDSYLGGKGGVEYQELHRILSQIFGQIEKPGNPYSGVVDHRGTLFFFLVLNVNMKRGERGKFILIRRNCRLESLQSREFEKEPNRIAQNITNSFNHSFKASIQNKVLKYRESDPRIMLVDDTEMNRIIGEMLLNELGFSADHARNGCEAVELCKRFKYDLILMDFHMPLMTGPVAAKMIKELVTYPIKIVACTSDQSKEAVLSCLEAGMSGFILKPFTKEKLQRVLFDT